VEAQRSKELAPAVPVPVSGGDDELGREVVRLVHSFASDAIDAAAIDRDRHIPTEVLTGLGELGLFGLTLPTEYGGAGLGAATACQAITALAEHDRSVATTLGLHLGLGTRGLVAFGTTAACETFLPSLATGAKLAAFATTESGAGSDLAAIQSRAHLEGETLVVNGQKIYVTNGGLAGVLTATVATPGLNGAERGTSVLVLDVTSPGVQVLGEERKLGLKGSSTTTIMLDEVRVPSGQVLGAVGKGAEYLNHILSWGRLLLSAGCVGTARTALRLTSRHVHERKQFGRLLAAQEVVQHQLTLMAARLFAMKALVGAAAEAEADFEALGRVTTSAKVFCSEGAGEVCDLALQLHGGSGFIEDTGVALLGRDARVTRIFEGANDVLLTHLGLSELARPTLADGLTAVSAQVRTFRAELIATHGGLKVMGRKAEQHRLGQACAWRDAAEASKRLAQRSGAALDFEFAGLVEQRAQTRIAALVQEVPLRAVSVLPLLASGGLP
jgi:alkylation response protein AidB-like acyl-CoA dehydrogenase